MREIPLTRGMVALVDDEDYEEVNRYQWHAVRKCQTWYAKTNIPRETGRRIKVGMHQVIMGAAPRGATVDHRNVNGLDNQRSNLRWATPSQQAANRPVLAKSGFKGVYLIKRRWRARIQIGGMNESLGLFITAEAAARAYDKRACEVFGEFAWLNFPREVTAQ